MGDNKFWLKLIGYLEKVRSRAEIKKSIKELGDFYVPVIPKINKTKAKSQVKKDLSGVTATIHADVKVDGKNLQVSTKKATKQAQDIADKNTIQFKANLDLKKSKLINDIKAFGKANSKMMKDAQMSSKYYTLLDNAKLASSNKELKNLRLQLSAMRSEIKATNQSGLSFGDTLKKTFKRATELFAGTGGIMLLSHQMREAWTEALNLDKAYTDLIKVQDELSRSDYPDYLERCNKKAQELATTQQALIESVTEFSKSGYNLTTSNALAEQSTVLSNVGDMSATDSSKAIISGVQAYSEVDGYTDVVDKAQALIDKYNEIGNTASITTAEIAQGVQEVGSVFADANTSVDEFIALLAAGNRQYQDADALSLALRTSALRIRGCTTELELMGEETEGVYTSASKLQEKIAGLTNINGGGGVQILEADGETFRSIYDIFLDISEVYSEMSDTDASALIELISGKHRASAISATLNNMSEAQEIYQRSLESAGSAQEEYSKYLESSEASLSRFKSSMTETYQSVISGETVTDILNCANATLQFVNSLGLVESSLKGLIAVGVVKAITTLSASFKASSIQASNFGTALKNVKNMSNMTKGTTEYTNALQSLKTACTGLTEKQLEQVLANKSLDNSTRIAILRTNGLTKSQAQAKLEQMKLTQSTKSQTVAQNSATASTFSLTSAIKGFSTQARAAFMNNPIGIGIMAISTLIGVATSKISKYKEELRETRQKMAEQAEESANHVKSLLELKEKLEDGTTSAEDLTTAFREQLRVMGYTETQIDSLISKYGNLATAIDETTREALENARTDAYADMSTSGRALIADAKGKTNVSTYYSQNEELSKQIKQMLEDSPAILDGGIYRMDKNASAEELYAYYNTLKDISQLIQETARATGDDSLLNGESVNPTPYEQVADALDAISESAELFGDAIGRLHNADAQLEVADYLKANNIDSKEIFDNYINGIKESTEYSEAYKQVLIGVVNDTFPQFSKQAIKASQDVRNSFVSALDQSELDKINEYQSKLNDLYEALNLLRSGIATPTDIDELIDKFPELSDDTEDLESAIKSLIDNALCGMRDIYGDVLDNFAEFAVKQNALDHSINTTAKAINSITSAYQSLNKAIEEYNENGYVSLDTLKQIMSMKPQYLSALIDENGKIKSNTDAYKSLVEIQLQEYEVSARKAYDLAREQNAEAIKQAAKDYGKGKIDLDEYTKRIGKLGLDDYRIAIEFIKSTRENLDKEMEEILKDSPSSTSDSKTTIDWLSNSIKNLQERVDDAQNTFDNTEGVDAQKKALVNLNKELQNLQNTYYSVSDNSNTAYGEYERRYKEALGKLGKDSSSIKSKIEAGHVFNTQEFSSDVAKIVNEAIDAYNGMKDSHNKYLELGVEIEGNLDKAFDLEFDNILDEFDKKLSHFENETKLIDAQLANAEARGQIATKAYYQSLQKVETNTYNALKANLEDLNRLMVNSSLDRNSDEWHNLQTRIEETNVSMQETLTTITDLDNKIRQIDWDLYDFAREQESQFIDEMDFLVDLLSSNKMYDDIGNITDEGLATMGLHAQSYNAYMEQSIKYTQEMKEIQKELEKTPTDMTLIDRYKELVERQQEAIMSSESLKESIVSLVTEGIEKQKDAMRDLIDSYLSAGESARDLYSWQKRSAESSKRIAAIQKQLSAYSGQDTEEARMMTQKLQMELEKESSDYEEQLMDRYLDDQRELLNSIYENYESSLNNYLSDTARVVSDSIDRVNDSNGVINDTIKSETQKVGYEISNVMKDIWAKEDGVFSDGFEGVADNVDNNTGVLEAFDEKMETLLREMESAVDLHLGEVTGDTEAMSGQLGGINAQATNMNSNLQNISNKLDAIVGKMDKTNTSDGVSATPIVGTSFGAISGSVTFKSKKSSYDKSKLHVDTSLVDLLKYHDFDSSVSARADYYKQMGFTDTYKDTSVQNSAMLEWLKKNGYKVNSYASGGKNLKEQLAWTQENGNSEYIIRKSDSAILTPLAQGDSVLNSEASKNLWNMANNPSNFIMDNLKFNLPDFNRINNNSVGNAQVDMNVEFVLPNVTNYNEFMRQAQSDRRFEGIVKDIVNHAIGNGSSLAKYRHMF